MVTFSRVRIKVWHFTYFTNAIPGQLNAKTKQKKKSPAILSFAATGGKWHFRNIFTYFFEFHCCFHYHTLIFEKKKLDFIAPEFNAELIGTNLKCQKSKTKKLICSFCTGTYNAISSLTRQWRHKSLLWIYLKNEKWFCSAVYFVCSYFWCLKTYIFFIFSDSLPLNNILETIDVL